MWYQSGMALTSGDFDGDGDQDLVVGAYKYPSGGQLYLVRNEAGMLSQPQPFAEVPMWYESGMAIESDDFDGDGVLELMVGAYEYNSGGRLYLFENDGLGNFRLDEP